MSTVSKPGEIRHAFDRMMLSGELDDLAADALQPMIKDWLDENLTDLMLQRVINRQQAVLAASQKKK